MPPTILWTKVKPRIPGENGAKIPMMFPQTEDTPRISEADGQGKIKKAEKDSYKHVVKQGMRKHCFFIRSLLINNLRLQSTTGY